MSLRLTAPVRHFGARSGRIRPIERSVADIMKDVLLGLVPGISVMCWQLGPGVLVQCVLAIMAAMLSEALVMRLRKRPVARALSDLSAIVTAVLLAISIPGFAPWWLVMFGTGFAILLGKQVYGGLGQNPFNPAMVAYASMLIAFPREMTLWPAPWDQIPSSWGIMEMLSAPFTWAGHSRESMDAITMATPLDSSRTSLSMGFSIDEAHARIFQTMQSSVWINLAFLSGGLWMLRRRTLDWRIPTGMLGGLFLIALCFFLYEPARHSSPFFHLLTGATQLGAFFIATDPVTAASTKRGRWIYGVGIGSLVFVIREWGGYPDGVAFAVLLMNFAAPTIDRFTQPRVYGHPR